MEEEQEIRRISVKACRNQGVVKKANSDARERSCKVIRLVLVQGSTKRKTGSKGKQGGGGYKVSMSESR